MQTIKVPFDRLEKVAHLADIHIRLFKRHDEYRKTFAKLYKDLASSDLDNGIILVAGDILHAKLDLSPEMVSLASDFLRSLANIAPTVIFDGNHDLNLANPHRMRSLLPIVENLNHHNLHYLVDSGVYRIADTDFALFGVSQTPEEWPSPEELKSDVTVALYHGPVYGAMTDTQFTITSRRVHPLAFKGFDIAMLGDIHKHQVLYESDPIIVYPSSLIQQNHGESYRGHGWCLWDVPSKTFEFKEIVSDFGYVTMEFDSSTISKFTIPDGLPKNIRLRLFTGDIEPSKMKKILAMVRKKYKVLDVSINPRRIASEYQPGIGSILDIGDLTDLNIQSQLITEWLETTFPEITSELMEKILDINKNVNENIIFSDFSRNIQWKPLEFWFSNLFSFGEGNHIDFRDLEGTHGIFAANATGKSSAMESLIYCLFDKTPRAFKGDHIMNNRKKTFSCHLKFEVNGTIYNIVREGKRKPNGAVKVDVDFWKEDENGEKTSLNGEGRYDTNSNIRARVGTYEDFILTSLSSQKGASLFIDKSNTERKTLLNQFMGLTIFEHLFEQANEESREIQVVLKKFNREDFTGKLAHLQHEIEDATKLNHELQGRIDECQRSIDEKQSEIEIRSSHKVNVPIEFHDPEKLAKEKTAHTVKYNQLESNIAILKVEYEVMKDQLGKLRSFLDEHDVDAIRRVADEYEVMKKLVFDNAHTIRLHTTLVDQKETQIEQLSSFKYNPDCEVCIENNKSKLEQIKKLEMEITSVQNKINSINKDILHSNERMEVIHDDYALYTRLTHAQTEYDRKKLTVEAHRNAIDRYQNQMDAVNVKIAEIDASIELTLKYEDQLKSNRTLDRQIVLIREQLDKEKADYRALEEEKLQEHGKVKVLEDRRSEILKELQEISDLEKDFEAYKYYMEAISRDGLPYDIISRAIPNIEDEINNILSQIVPFTIALDVDGKNFGGRIIYGVDKSWPLENSSGMEAFVSSLAIRVALLKASNLPKSNFLIVDEGMGTLDSEYLHGMQLLFDMLKDEFEFIIIISHLDNIRDMVDNIIEISQTDGYSYITN